MTDWSKKITENINEFLHDIQKDEDLKKLAKDIKSTGKKAWGKLHAGYQEALDKLSDIPDNTWAKALKGAFEGRITLPTEKIKKKVEKRLLASQEGLSSIDLEFKNDRINVNFEMGKTLPLKGHFSLTLFQINITKLQQTITFQIDKPLAIEYQNIPEETLLLISTFIGLSLDDSMDYEHILPTEIKHIAKKDSLWQIDLSKFEEFNKWCKKEILGKSIIDFFSVYHADIKTDFINLYPQFNET